MGSNSFTGSNKLMKLAQQLSLYNPLKETHINNSIKYVMKKKKKNPVDLENERSRPKSNRAAVLICLFEDEGDDLRVILTKRSSTLSSHSGEVSLPGGKWEESDADDVQTALREAHEEIGLDPSLVDVVSVLQPITTKHGMIVVPVIGILYDKNAFNPAPNAAEVEAIFDAPLEMFLKDENRTEEEREWMGNKYLLHFFDYEAENKKYVIWALTAGILITAASLVYQKQPAFSERKPKFWTTSHQ